MAEKRMISKVISVSKKVNLRLNNHFSRLFYTWLIPHADDFGRLSGCPHKLRALIIPMLKETYEDVEKALMDLQNAELIIWYEVNGEQYLQIVNFDEHQQGLHKRTTSKFPEVPGDSRKFPEIPSEGKGTELNRTEGNRREEEGKGTAPTPDLLNSIQNLLNQCKVQKATIHSIEVLASYIGVVEKEVIEAAIKKAEGKHINYAINTIEGWVSEGKTTKEQVMPTPKRDNVHQYPNNRTQSGKPKADVYNAPAELMTYEEHKEGELVSAELEGRETPSEDEIKTSYQTYLDSFNAQQRDKPLGA